MSKDKTEPMDPGAPEVTEAVTHVNEGRTAYALKTLVAEVLDLFPETSHEFSERDGRNTALAVTFDLTNLDLDDRDKFASLLSLAKADERVAEVIVDEDGLVCVRLRGNARTQDDRTTFDLVAIWEDMGEDAPEPSAEPVVVDVETFPFVVDAPADPVDPAEDDQ